MVIVAVALIAAVSIALAVLVVRRFPNAVGREPSWVLGQLSGRSSPLLTGAVAVAVIAVAIIAAFGFRP